MVRAARNMKRAVKNAVHIQLPEFIPAQIAIIRNTTAEIASDTFFIFSILAILPL
jgi:hypothetical protein